jgi:hypothetical protein
MKPKLVSSNVVLHTLYDSKVLRQIDMVSLLNAMNHAQTAEQIAGLCEEIKAREGANGFRRVIASMVVTDPDNWVFRLEGEQVRKVYTYFANCGYPPVKEKLQEYAAELEYLFGFVPWQD